MKHTSMTDKLEKWEKMRAKGKWNYIFIYGVLGWGVGTGILFSLFFPLVTEAMGSEAPFLPVFALSIVLFPLGGIAWAWFMWIYAEKFYWEAKASEQAPELDADTPHR
jgi:uncharacterized membrane protein